MQSKRLIVIIGLVLAVILTVMLLTGCYQTPNPVDFIDIFKARPIVPPSFGLGAPIDPHPDFIQEVLSPGDKIFLGLVISRENKEDITFSRYTFHNKRTGQEIVVGTHSDLGPFEPGQITLVAFSNPWIVPEQPDTYEVRIYMGSDIVASAIFEVK